MLATALPPRAGCALWLIPLGGKPPADAHSLLSPDERERAGRFRFERDRHRFIIARAALRQLLAAQVGGPAHALRFTYGPQGKPALAQAPECRFNLSHSEEWGLLAIDSQDACDCVGVDIELLRPVPDALPLAAGALNAHDTQALRALAQDELSRGFLTAWTRGEACLKAMGTGFSGPTPPAVGIDAAPRAVALAMAASGERIATVESFELPQAGAIASLAVVAQCRMDRSEYEMAGTA